MKLKKYSTPDIEIMEIETAAMIASSEIGNGVNGDGTKGYTGSTTGGSGPNARISSLQYFDGWDLDDADEE